MRTEKRCWAVKVTTVVIVILANHGRRIGYRSAMVTDDTGLDTLQCSPAPLNLDTLRN